jgi:CHASE2 domain-containing sensor protein
MLAIAMPRASARMLAVLCGVVVIALAGGGWAAYSYANLLIDPIYPIITLIIFITVITFHIYRYSEAQRSSIRRFFGPRS